MPETLSFDELLSSGDVVGAICSASFGYRSVSGPEGFRFTITSGPMAGRVGEGRELIDAVRAAVSREVPGHAE